MATELPQAVKDMKADAEKMLEEATRKGKVARDLIKAVTAYEAELEESDEA